MKFIKIREILYSLDDVKELYKYNYRSPTENKKDYKLVIIYKYQSDPVCIVDTKENIERYYNKAIEPMTIYEVETIEV
jgi:hypothetical protein